MPARTPSSIEPFPVRSMRAKISSASASMSFVIRSRKYEPRGVLRRQRQHLVERVRVQRLRAAKHRGERLQRGPHPVVLRLLRREGDAGGLRMEPHPHRALVVRSVALAHPPRPDATGGAELRELLEEVDVRIEEEREAWGEPVDVQAA